MEKYIVIKDYIGQFFTIKKGEILIVKKSAYGSKNLYNSKDTYICGLNSYLEKNYCKPYEEPNYPTYNLIGESHALLDSWVLKSDGQYVGVLPKFNYGSKIKVYINKGTTVIILEDGSKGIAKCNPEDIYDINKGIDIAYKRACVKSIEKEIKKLIK